MAFSQMTLGDRWQDQFLAGATLLHILLKLESPARPRDELRPEILIRLLEDVASDRYTSSKYFETGSMPNFSLVTQPPALSGKTSYLLVGLNALTRRGQFASTIAGGIIFEDPVWAILAAHSLSEKTFPALAVPLAKDNDSLWKRLLPLADAVHRNAYNRNDFLGKIEGFVPPATGAKFELIAVDSDQLSALRGRGVQALTVERPPRFFELFEKP